MALTRPHGRVRPLLAGAVLLGISALFVPSTVSGAPAQAPTPTIASVTAELDTLANQTTALTDQYNAAQADLRVKQMQASISQRAAAQASAAYQTARTDLTRIVAADYEQSSFSHAGALLTSQNGQGYLDAINTLSLLSIHRASVVEQATTAEAKAKAAQKAASQLLADAQSRREALAAQRGKIITQAQTLKKLLATLTLARQRALAQQQALARLQANQTRHAPNTPTQINAAAAVNAGTAAAQWATQCAQPAPNSVGACGGVTGYVNPFAHGSWTAERTDQGTDWAANQPQPVVAIGDGMITYSNSQQNGWPAGKFLVYGLSSGSHAGLFIFVAENLSDLLPAGTPVKAGQQIAVAIPGGPNIEMGFAAPPGTGPNVATPYNGSSDGSQTEGGKAFARFLIELGAHPQQDPGPGPDRP